MLRNLVAFSMVVAPLLLGGCGGGGSGGSAPTNSPGVTTTTGTPASATFPAASAYRSYAGSARQQQFSLPPAFSYCSGSATLSETAPSAATFESAAALRRTLTLVSGFTNCIPSSITEATEVFLDANNDTIGEFRIGEGYAVLDSPLVLPQTVKVGDTGTTATASLYADSTKSNRVGTVEYSFRADADNRADAILVRLTATATNALGQQLFSELKTFRITADGAMELYSMNLGQTGKRLLYMAE